MMSGSSIAPGAGYAQTLVLDDQPLDLRALGEPKYPQNAAVLSDFPANAQSYMARWSTLYSTSEDHPLQYHLRSSNIPCPSSATLLPANDASKFDVPTFW